MADEFNKDLTSVLKLEGFRKIAVLKKDEFGRIHGIAYDSRNRKYFIKAATGKDTYTYKVLRSETYITYHLANLTKRQTISLEGYRLIVPKVARIINRNNMTIFISDFINGKRLLDEPSPVMANKLVLTLKLITLLSKEVSQTSIKNYLDNYSRFKLLIDLPLKLIRSVWNSPQNIFRLVMSAIKATSIIWLNTGKPGLVHADINASNILISGKNIYLTDWEQCGWGLSVYNAIGPLCVHWTDIYIRKSIENYLSKISSVTETNSLLAYRILILFNQKLPITDSRKVRDLEILNSIT